jgi:choline dehydrogenase-like flavoprotein
MKSIAIIGSGIVGTTLAYQFVKAGHAVHLFEAGPETPYPHAPQYEREVLYSSPFSASSDRGPSGLPDGVRGLSQSGDYGQSVDEERSICVGGQATRWFGITPRLTPESFRPKTLHGYGDDWPITYHELEPYYCRAEDHLGISGSAADNPFAPPRSKDYPLPPFELGYTDLILAAKLREEGLYIHTTPQARARADYDGRPACENFGVCGTCPIGARYSPNHHLELAGETELLTLHTRAPVRRIIMQGHRARAILYNPDYGPTSVEHPADLIIVAAGGLESARLLLLSGGSGLYPDGIGNASGQLGRNLAFHHVWWGSMILKHKMMPGRAGPPTALSHQFANPPGRRNYGGMTAELFDGYDQSLIEAVGRKRWRSGGDIVEALRPGLNRRNLTFNAETVPGPGKYIDLSGPKDRFGDPFAHLRYELDAFDEETYAMAQTLSKRFAGALDAEAVHLASFKQFWSAHHHLGTCRMGDAARTSVVDSYGMVHETQGLYVCGGSTFVTPAAFQPTLTMVALALRSADKLLEELR